MAYAPYTDVVIEVRQSLGKLIKNNTSDTQGIYDVTPNALHELNDVAPRTLEQIRISGLSLDELVELSKAIPLNLEVRSRITAKGISKGILIESNSTHQYIFNELVARHNNNENLIFHMDGERVNMICRQIRSDEKQKKYIEKLQEKVIDTPALLISNLEKLRSCEYIDKVLLRKRELAIQNRNHDIFWGTRLEPATLYIANKHIDNFESIFLQKKYPPKLIEYSLSDDNYDKKLSQSDSGLYVTPKGYAHEADEMEKEPRKEKVTVSDQISKTAKTGFDDPSSLSDLFERLGDRFDTSLNDTFKTAQKAASEERSQIEKNSKRNLLTSIFAALTMTVASFILSMYLNKNHASVSDISVHGQQVTTVLGEITTTQKAMQENQVDIRNSLQDIQNTQKLIAESLERSGVKPKPK